jgi:HAD superfamily hydrolase (TIGR01459 family)
MTPDRVGEQALMQLPARYRVILCDVWGCVHNGVQVFPEAAALLSQWRAEGRIVLLLTNAPRTAAAVRRQLENMGLTAASYDGIVTSGDTGIAALNARGLDNVGFIGTATDRRVLEEAGLRLREGPVGNAVVCTGLTENRPHPRDYDDDLDGMRARDAWFLCFNPDRMILRGDVSEPCAGAIAERYEAMGGKVSWYGKPYAPVYERALSMAGEIRQRTVDRSEVLAIGDGLATDILGAAQAGLDFVFVSGGIEAAKVESEGAEALMARFAAERNLTLPMPIATVSRLAAMPPRKEQLQ